MSNFRIENIEDNDRDEAIEFMIDNYFKDEPLWQCLDMKNSIITISEISYYIKHYLSGDGIFLKVLDKNNKIVGISLSTIHLNKYERSKIDTSLMHPEVLKIEKLSEKIFLESKISSLIGNRTSLYMRFGVVAGSCRSLGLGKLLYKKTWELAKEKGCDCIFTFATNHHSYLGLQNLNMHSVYTLNYADHKDENGKIIFETRPPHVAVNVMFIEIPKKT